MRIAVGATDNASNVIDKVRDSFARLQKQGASGIVTGLAAGAALAAFNAIEQAARDAVQIGEDAVRAAIDQEASLARLTAALKENVPAWDGNTDAIKRAVTAGAAKGFNDQQVEEGLAHLAAATHNVTQAVNLQAVAMDLARFRNIDLADASDKLIRVIGGSSRVAKELGIDFGKTSTVAERLALIEGVVGGQAEAFGKTTAGAMARAGEAVHVLQEELGSKLLPVVAQVAEFMTSTLIPAIEKLVDVIDKAKPIWDFIGSVLAKAAEPLARYADGVVLVSDTYGNLTKDTFAAAAGMDESTRSSTMAAAAANAAAISVDDLSSSFTDAAQAAAIMASGVATTGADAMSLADAAKIAAQANATLADNLDATAFGADTADRALRSLTKTLADGVTPTNAEADAVNRLADAVARHAEASGTLVQDPSNVEGTASLHQTQALAKTIKSTLPDAYATAKRAGDAMYSALHTANSKAIDDVRDLANAKLTAQEKEIQGYVDTQKAKLAAERAQTQENQLRADVAAAAPGAAKDAAVAALNSFLADQRINFLQGQATTKIGGLEGQKAVNNAADIAAQVVNDAWFKKAQAGFDRSLDKLLKLGRPIQLVNQFLVDGHLLKQIIADYLAGENLLRAPAHVSTAGVR